jgi:hypothetical protein
LLDEASGPTYYSASAGIHIGGSHTSHIEFWPKILEIKEDCLGKNWTCHWRGMRGWACPVDMRSCSSLLQSTWGLR